LIGQIAEVEIEGSGSNSLSGKLVAKSAPEAAALEVV